MGGLVLDANTTWDEMYLNTASQSSRNTAATTDPSVRERSNNFLKLMEDGADAQLYQPNTNTTPTSNTVIRDGGIGGDNGLSVDLPSVGGLLNGRQNNVAGASDNGSTRTDNTASAGGLSVELPSARGLANSGAEGGDANTISAGGLSVKTPSAAELLGGTPRGGPLPSVDNTNRVSAGMLSVETPSASSFLGGTNTTTNTNTSRPPAAESSDRVTFSIDGPTFDMPSANSFLK